MDAISSQTKQQSAKAVYNKLTAELDGDDASRNAAVVHNKKSREARMERQNGNEHSDEFQCVFSAEQQGTRRTIR